MTKNKLGTAQVVSWVITLCRILIGALVIKTGFDLASGTGAFAYNQSDNIMTGVFVMSIGIYFVFSSISRQFFKDK